MQLPVHCEVSVWLALQAQIAGKCNAPTESWSVNHSGGDGHQLGIRQVCRDFASQSFFPQILCCSQLFTSDCWLIFFCTSSFSNFYWMGEGLLASQLLSSLVFGFKLIKLMTLCAALSSQSLPILARPLEAQIGGLSGGCKTLKSSRIQDISQHSRLFQDIRNIYQCSHQMILRCWKKSVWIIHFGEDEPSYNINLAKATEELEGSNQLMTVQFKYWHSFSK